MHRLMLIGSIMMLVGGTTASVTYFIGQEALAVLMDNSAFLSGYPTIFKGMFSAISRLFPFFAVLLLAMATLYIFLYIMRQRGKNKPSSKVMALLFGFSVMVLLALYSGIYGWAMVSTPSEMIAEASVAMHTRIIGFSLLGVALGCVVTQIGAFKA